MKMLEPRQQAIVQELMKYDYPVSGTHLAGMNDVTARTIREDIKLVNLAIGAEGAEIQSLMGQGYRLVIEDVDAFKSFLKESTGRTCETTATHQDSVTHIVCD